MPADEEPQPDAEAAGTAEPEAPSESGPPKRKLTFKISNGEGIKGQTEEPTTYVMYTLPGPKVEGESGETTGERVAASATPAYNITEEVELEVTEALVNELVCGFKVTVMEFIDGKNPVHQAIGTAVLDLRGLIFAFDPNAEEVLSVSKQCALDAVEGASLTMEVRIDEPLIDEAESFSNNMLTVTIGSAHSLPESWLPKDGETNETHGFFYSLVLNGHGFDEQQYPQSTFQFPSGEAVPGTEPPAEPEDGADAPAAAEPMAALSDDELRAWREQNSAGIRWTGTLSKYVSAEGAAKLKAALESGAAFTGELDKYLKSGNPYPYTAKYHTSLMFILSTFSAHADGERRGVGRFGGVTLERSW